jgi:hypothetical protein
MTRRSMRIGCAVGVVVCALVATALVPTVAEAQPAGSLTHLKPQIACEPFTVRTTYASRFTPRYFRVWVPAGSTIQVAYKGFSSTRPRTRHATWNPTTPVTPAGGHLGNGYTPPDADWGGEDWVDEELFTAPSPGQWHVVAPGSDEFEENAWIEATCRSCRRARRPCATCCRHCRSASCWVRLPRRSALWAIR